MGEAFRTWAPVIAATIVALPLAAIAVAGLAAWRIRTGLGRGRAWLAGAAEVGMVVGTLPWIWMILTPGSGPGTRATELIPGRGLAELLTGEPGAAVVQVGGNLLVFAAFGFLAPLRWRLGLLAVASLAAAGSTVVEVLQYALQLGRVSSVDDVALNTLGAVLAGLASRRWWRRAPAERVLHQT
jgi:hypothetical protein